MMECRGLLPLIAAACFIGLVGSQTTLTPAVVSTTLIENVTSLTITPVILSSTTPGCSAFNTSTCEPCAPGSQYDNNTLLCACCSDPGLCLFPGACLACARGFYQSLAGQQQCLPCSQGSYTNFTGSPLCHPCPAGSFNNNSGADSCTSCSPGFFSSQLSSTMCAPCSRGSFCNSSGCSHCQMCPVGTEALQNAAKDCTQCRPGMHKASHQTMCQICGSGFYQIHWGQESCDVCPENHYCPVSAAASTFCTLQPLQCAPTTYCSLQTLHPPPSDPSTFVFERCPACLSLISFFQSPDVNPILCPNDAFCPAGSLAPGYCMETFFRKAGDVCELAPVTIALLVIGGGVALLFIILMILRRRRDTDGELTVARAPLLCKERPQGRYYGIPCDAEPVYAGW
nr:PREDICTED: multiple epidermal growth factor-like domains protein 11 isoform X1 [Paralichthys olivaceus]